MPSAAEPTPMTKSTTNARNCANPANVTPSRPSRRAPGTSSRRFARRRAIATASIIAKRDDARARARECDGTDGGRDEDVRPRARRGATFRRVKTNRRRTPPPQEKVVNVHEMRVESVDKMFGTSCVPSPRRRSIALSFTCARARARLRARLRVRLRAHRPARRRGATRNSVSSGVPRVHRNRAFFVGPSDSLALSKTPPQNAQS